MSRSTSSDSEVDADYQSENDDLAMQSENDDLAVQSENDDLAVQSENDDLAVQNENDDLAVQNENDDLALQSSEHSESNHDPRCPLLDILDFLGDLFPDSSNSQHCQTPEPCSVTRHENYSPKSDNGKGSGTTNFQPGTCTSRNSYNLETFPGDTYCRYRGCGRYLENSPCTNDHICSDEPFHHFQCHVQYCGLRFIHLSDLSNHLVSDHLYEEE
jgi:hypothetical protein